ncbi:hypothetical protein [Acinetobacter pragensis]|uniref:Lipoprotein n=1 Tax=Acinetobacter pragensis TaxID=1806892 RepID=A0A151XZ24_9GAMM|nr:hypothetical protein [Acinetobacter pragensis]KYQ70839.1 hypothetical protein AZH43_17160 [Acinetobacter pragensis]
MKKFLQGALLPFSIFATGMVLLGCDQAAQQENVRTEQSQAEADQNEDIQADANSEKAPARDIQLKSGNMFYVIRDVADLQLKAGDYVEQLQQTKTELQHAVDLQDHEKLQQTASQLQKQLTGFNQALTAVNLKTQEISDIRSNILSANEQVLASPFLNGQVDLSKVDLKKIEQQMVSIQSEMVKLAGMLIQSSSSDRHETSQS